jgi:hypothetical protein
MTHRERLEAEESEGPDPTKSEENGENMAKQLEPISAGCLSFDLAMTVIAYIEPT